jgi:hypothetical protein
VIGHQPAAMTLAAVVRPFSVTWPEHTEALSQPTPTNGADGIPACGSDFADVTA